MGTRRAPEYEKARSLEERMAARDRADRAPPVRTGRAVNLEDQVVGAHATHIYHLPSCTEIEDVAQAERVLFVTNHDALDGGYTPCPVCRPGP